VTPEGVATRHRQIESRDSSLNIIIVNDAASIRGGADRVAFDSAAGLAAMGHRVILFTGFGPVDPVLEAIPGVTIHCLGTGWLKQEQTSPKAVVRGMWNFAAARRLREVLGALNRSDSVVHVHLYAAALTSSVLHASLAAGFPTILTLHDYFITCPNGAYFVFPTAQQCERHALSLSCLACNCDSRKPMHKYWRFARTWLQGRLAKIPARITAYAAVSETCATLARRDLPKTARIEVVPNIVAVERGVPVDVARNRALVFTGRLEDYKGPQLLAMAAARLGVPVVFCGTGPMEHELRRLCPEATFTGWLTPERVLEELGRARAFVFPSVYRETFGLSAAEALARGVPVIASRGTAAEEFVLHGQNGLLFEHNSVDDLAKQLALLADDGMVRRLGSEAYRIYWEKPLTTEAHIARLQELYASVRGRAESPPAGLARVGQSDRTVPV
jgi:glycosyltransferase involved in cell wall biosynthesis